MGTVQREVTFSKADTMAIFFEPIWTDMMAQGEFRVMANVTSKKKIGFVQKLENIIQKSTGCGFDPKGKVGFYTREIEVDDFKVNISQCFQDFKDTIFEDQFKKGILKYDINGTMMGRILVDRVRDAMNLDYTRLFWFGDKSSTDTSNNITNGMWSVHIPALVADNETPYINAGSGSPLASGDAIALLKKMYKAQATPLKGLPDSMKYFYVSQSIWDAYQDDLEITGGGDGGRNQLIDGVNVLTYRGIQLKVQLNWDQYTTNVLGNPNTHQALLTIPDNLVMATDLLGDLNRIEIFFDKLEKQTYLNAEGKFGTNYVHAQFMVAAY